MEGRPLKSEAVHPSPHHFAIQAPLMILPLGSVPCLVRTASPPSGSRQTAPSVEGKIMVGKMMVRWPDGQGPRVFVFQVRFGRVRLLRRASSWAATVTPALAVRARR